MNRQIRRQVIVMGSASKPADTSSPQERSGLVCEASHEAGRVADLRVGESRMIPSGFSSVHLMTFPLRAASMILRMVSGTRSRCSHAHRHVEFCREGTLWHEGPPCWLLHPIHMQLNGYKSATCKPLCWLLHPKSIHM